MAPRALLVVVAFFAPMLLHRHELLRAALTVLAVIARLGWFRARPLLAHT